MEQPGSRRCLGATVVVCRLWRTAEELRRWWGTFISFVWENFAWTLDSVQVVVSVFEPTISSMFCRFVVCFGSQWLWTHFANNNERPQAYLTRVVVQRVSTKEIENVLIKMSYRASDLFIGRNTTPYRNNRRLTDRYVEADLVDNAAWSALKMSVEQERVEELKRKHKLMLDKVYGTSKPPYFADLTLSKVEKPTDSSAQESPVDGKTRRFRRERNWIDAKQKEDSVFYSESKT